MHNGRDKNTIELYKYGLISMPFLVGMLLLNQIKFIRRECIVKTSRLKQKHLLNEA